MHCSTCGKSDHRKNKCTNNATGAQNGEQTGGENDDINGVRNDEQDGGQPKQLVKAQRTKLPVRRKVQTNGQNEERNGGQKGGTTCDQSKKPAKV